MLIEQRPSNATTPARQGDPPVELTLLGGCALTVGDIYIRDFATDKERALLAFLALEQSRPQRREYLATLFWPESSTATALKNLRQSLYRLKQTLDGAQAGLADRLLLVTAKEIGLKRAALQVDALTLNAAITASEKHTHPSLASCNTCLIQLGEVVALYEGELLAGLGVRDAPFFEEWLLLRREILHHQVLLVLQNLALAYESRGEPLQAYEYAHRQLALDPYREDAHRQVIRLLAQRGMTHQALAHYATCRRLLQEEFGALPAPETVALYEQIRAGKLPNHPINRTAKFTEDSQELPSTIPDRATGASPLTERRYPHNLPATPLPMVGRQAELADLLARLQAPGSRLWTLVGMGGVGKTRLALAVSQAIVDCEAQKAPRIADSAEADNLQSTIQNPQFPHGVWFVPLIGVAADPPHVQHVLAEVICKTLGMATTGGNAVQTQLFDYLVRRQLLLLLDNFEHLLAEEAVATQATGFLLALLRAAPGVTVLVTSRTALHLGLEEVFPLTGLPVPEHKATDSATYDSVRLFVQGAQAAMPAFRVDADTLAAVVEICQLIGGLPLGIELAATLVRHFAPPEIVRAIRQNPDILVSPRRDIDERHRRLTAVFESSWQLLTVTEQRALMQAAIFVGPFSGSAAGEITGATHLDFINLTEQSLLRQPAPGLYELHELVRQWVAHKLAALEPTFVAALQARYARYYLGFVAERREPLRHRTATLAITQIRQVSANIRCAWELALTHGWLDALAPALEALLRYWKITGRYEEGEALVSAALPALEPLAARQDAPLPAPPLLIHLWLALAECLHGQNRWKAALAANERALTLAARDEPLQARALILLAEGLSWQGRHDEAKPFAERAQALAQQNKLWEVEVRALIVLAWYCETLEARLAPVARALEIAQRQGDPYFELLCTQNLAGACENEGDYARSLPYRRQALRLAQASQDCYQIGEGHYLYGLVHVHLGLYPQAIEHFQAALALAQEHSFTWLEKRCANRLSMVYTVLGELDKAYDWSVQARTATHNDNEPPPYFEFVYAQILGAQGRWGEAALIYQRVLLQKGGNTGMALTRCLPELAELARLALRQGDLRQALAYGEEIGEILSQQPHFSMHDVYFNLYAIYVAWYEAFQAAGDPRAQAILEASYQKLTTYATGIVDGELRSAYLENVAANRELIAAWRTAHAEPPGTTDADQPVLRYTIYPSHPLLLSDVKVK